MEDAATKGLMALFYGRFTCVRAEGARGGETTGDAALSLRMAMCEIIGGRGRWQPKQWAAFAMCAAFVKAAGAAGQACLLWAVRRLRAKINVF